MPAHVPPASSSLLRRRHSCAATALGVLLLGVAAAAAAGQYLGLPLRDFELLGTYPHDPRAFTQGLVFDRGQLIEGTGRYGESRVLVRELGDARPLREHRLPRQLFGEGVAVVGDRVLQLTWRARVGFVYARDTLAPLGHFRYDTEGWGLAYDEVRLRLLKSDGSARLEFMHPLTLAVTGSCEVRAGTIPVTRLNELEMVAGLLYANVWGSDYIARIDPESCTVRDWVDLSRLSARFAAQADVLNGIAYDAAADRLFVTGKLWPALYEIKVIEPGG